VFLLNVRFENGDQFIELRRSPYPRSHPIRLRIFKHNNVNIHAVKIDLSDSESAAAALSRGVETEFRQRLRDLSGELKYLYVESRYVTGFRVAQIPKHQGTALLTYNRGGTFASMGLRTYSYQFDDDLNVYRLPGYASLQFVMRQRLARALSAEVTLENALNHQFYTAFTPTPNIGAPRLWRLGLRWDGRVH
jgi:outer membrane receptor protein involved in Fe transport